MKTSCLFAILISSLSILPVFAQNCNCNFTITQSGSYSPSNLNAQAGATICIQAGTYSSLSFNNFQGTESQPIIIKNCSGQVVIQNTTNATGIHFGKSKNIKLTGSGDNNLTYGIKIAGTGNNSRGVNIGDKSSNIEVERLEIQNIGGTGILVKTDMTCDSTTWRDYYAMYQIKLHDNYIHDTVGDGISVGDASYGTGKTITCNGASITKFTHLIYGLAVYNNRFERTGGKAIQYGNTPDAMIHHNYMKSCGKQSSSSTLNNSVAINGSAGGDFYSNTIIDAEGTAIMMVGFLGNQNIYNNLIVRPKGNAIFSDSRPSSIPNTYLRIANNTIVSPQTEALKLYSLIHTHEVVNNIMLNAGNGKFISPLSSSVNISARKNYLNTIVDPTFFEDITTENYRPLSHTPLINTGENLQGWGINSDISYIGRPNGADFDIGCFESASAVSTHSASTCDYTIWQSGEYSPLNLSAEAGNTICILPGNYTNLKLSNFVGSDTQPLIIKNASGQVVIQNSTTNLSGISFSNCRYFQLTGTGDTNVPYGIKIAGTGSGAMGITVGAKSSDCEIDHLEISNTGFAGIMTKTDPSCDASTWKGNFVMTNVKLHHNYVHDVAGEGIYAGNSFASSGVTVTCSGISQKVYPHTIEGLEIYENHFERIGCEGIQYGCSTNAKVHHNTIINSGVSPFDNYQSNGIQIGEGSGGDCYNNTVINARGTGIIMLGFLGNQTVYNNLIVNAGYNGLFADSRSSSIPNTFLRIANNSIINSQSDAIKLYSLIHSHEVVNNLIINPATGKFLVKLGTPVLVNERNNFMNMSIGTAFLNDAANGNYYPTSNSPLVNTGENLSNWGIVFDRDNNARPSGSGYDIGSFEFIQP